MLPSSAFAAPLDDDEFERAEKQRQREFERASRNKRRAKLQAMRSQVSRLEQLELAIRVAPDSDAVWDEFLDDATKQVRCELRRLSTAVAQAMRLRREKLELQYLLENRQLVRQTITRLLRSEAEMNDWESNVEHWRRLARDHYQTLTMDHYVSMVTDALNQIHRFKWGDDKVSSGMDFLGWQDSRRLELRTSTMAFSLDKRYRGLDLPRSIEMMWRVFTEGEVYSRVVLSPRSKVAVYVLQQLSPTACVIRIDEKYAEAQETIHSLYLLVRVETDDGAIQFVKSIEDKTLKAAINEPSDLWTTNFKWMQWEVLSGSKSDPSMSLDYRVSVGGSIKVRNRGYLSRWFLDLVAVLVRFEGVFTGSFSYRF